MTQFRVTRSLHASVERVWEIVGNPATSPGPGIDVHVEQEGASDGTGLVRVVKAGVVTAREVVTDVGPGPVIRYHVTKGVPARDYTSSVALEESAGGGTLVTWDGRFRPLVPGTGWAVTLIAKHTLNRVLDAVAASSGVRGERGAS